MSENKLVSISEAARRAEVDRETVRRWIKKGALAVHPGKKVDPDEVRWLSCSRGIAPGRPCGVKQARARDAQSPAEAAAAPFLTSGVRGLKLFDKVLRFVQMHYLKEGRGDKAAEVVQSAAGFLPLLRERYGADFIPGKDWKDPRHWKIAGSIRATEEDREAHAKLVRQVVAEARLGGKPS